jgi:hypothetical protein
MYKSKGESKTRTFRRGGGEIRTCVSKRDARLRSNDGNGFQLVLAISQRNVNLIQIRLHYDTARESRRVCRVARAER